MGICVFGIMERFVRVTCPRVAYVLPKYRFISVSVNFKQTRYVLFLGKVMPNFDMTLHACMHFVYNPFACYTVQLVMKVSGWKVERYLQSAVMDMYANNRTRIRCPCTRCKEGVLLDPFDRGSLKAHLLMNGFMDGYTWWISEDDDDDEDVHMAGNNDMGLDEEMTDRHEDDGAGHGGREESGHDSGGEDSGHGEEESGHGGEEAEVTPQCSTLL